MKKVLILECPVTTGGSGHEVAARAIEAALRKTDKSIKTLCVCPIKGTSKTSKYVSFVYLKLIKYTPKVMGYIHGNKTLSKITNATRNRLDKVGYKGYKDLIDSFKPDAIVCTHAYPCWVVSFIKEKTNLKAPLIGVVTDFYAHYYWPSRNVDKYVVATEEAKNDLLSRGLSENKVEDIGIPIDPKFTEKKDKLKIWKKLRLKPNSTILVMGGGLGIGPMNQLVKLLDTMDNINIIAVCGKNTKSRDKLLKSKFKNKIIVKGYVSNMDELMEVSDIAVTKAGGLTVSECLAKNLPMVIVNPIPGQEERNTDYLIKHNFAVKLKSKKHLTSAVKDLLKKGVKNKLAKPNSAIDVAKLITGAIK